MSLHRPDVLYLLCRPIDNGRAYYIPWRPWCLHRGRDQIDSRANGPLEPAVCALPTSRQRIHTTRFATTTKRFCFAYKEQLWVWEGKSTSKFADEHTRTARVRAPAVQPVARLESTPPAATLAEIHVTAESTVASPPCCGSLSAQRRIPPSRAARSFSYLPPSHDASSEYRKLCE
jgi:hypothetical protein